MTKTVTFEATKSRGKVTGLLEKPPKAEMILVFAHGAGAGMRNRFMDEMSARLAGHRIATFRYHFPYMEKGTKRPDPKPVLLSTVRSAVRTTRKLVPSLPMIAGGKSMGGRMTSTADAEEPLEGVQALVFFGFPLHPPGAKSAERADHLYETKVPLLFLQGTRDSLADLDLLKPVCGKLGRRALLHVVEGADHSFHVLKSSGRTDADVLTELAGVVAEWGKGMPRASARG